VSSSRSQTASRHSTAATPAATPSRALAVALLVLALAGLAVAIELVVLHARVTAGAGPSFCTVSEHVNCDKVAASRWSVLLGVPLAAWGALAYLVVAGMAAAALPRSRPHPAWPAGLLVLVTGAMSAAAVALAAISELVIRSLCIVCAVSWAISFALLIVSWRLAKRAGGPRVALAHDLGVVRGRPLPAAAAAGVLALLAGALLAWYARSPAPAAIGGGAVGSPVGPPGSVVVYEYSDYQCPFCARMHDAIKPLLARRPDIRVLRRQFPLDDACNPKVARPFHVGACDQARAAICAEAQGLFDAMDDALFANQEGRAPLEAVARQAGLDLEKLRACMDSPETSHRLREDIADGIAAGVRATPSYAYQGKLYQGELPPVLGGATRER
jgi:protein-disulfide isomerase/uncharacterized membrane protein